MTEQEQREQRIETQTANGLVLVFCVIVLVLLTGCASPRDAKITNGQVENITSAEAVTLVKQNERSKRAKAVQTDAKPIFKLVAQPGQVITFGGVQSVEVNVPIDPALLMSDAPDAVSENVQLLREARGVLRETVVPLGLGYQVLQDRKDSRAAGLEESRLRAAAQSEQNQTQADLVRQMLDKDPIVITVPAGGEAGYLTRD
jgi:hypothetical protein